MKKCKLLLPVLLFCWSASTAQIVINNADMPVAGDTLRMSMGVAFTGMDAAQTGPNHSWDFSGLTSLTQTIDTFLTVSSTDPVYALYFLNVGINKNRSNLAQRGMNIAAVPGLTIDEVFNFYYNSSSRFEQTGFGAAINGITVPTAYSPHDTIYHFPLAYGNTDSSYSHYDVEVPGTLSFFSDKFRRNEVDGWGTLTTPYGTFDALRVKTILQETDSVYINQFGFGFKIPLPAQVQYKWLAKGEGEPLLQVNTTGGVPTQIIYRDSLRAPFNIAVQPVNPFEIEPLVYPNPAATVQTIIYSLRADADVKLEVYTVTGEKIKTLADERQAALKHVYTLNVGDETFCPGVYLLKLSVNGINYQQKLMVSK